MLKDFEFYAPTRVVFGKDSEERIAEMVSTYGGKRVLVHYGGQSALRSGLIDKVCEQLGKAGIAYSLLGGVVPNPLLSKVYEGIDLCRKEQIDFILAVGGGSVIDSAKAIGYGACFDGDVWQFWEGKGKPSACLPIGVVLTIPAAGSEMSSSCVITKDEGALKRGINSDLCRCKFAIMNPLRTCTLPPYQTAAGATDILMHTMERYFSKYTDMSLTDALAEALMRTVIDSAPKVLANPNDYRHRAQIMWAGSLSHNDLTECGTEKDFATHRLEHELSALFGVTHGAGLAALWGSWARYVIDSFDEQQAPLQSHPAERFAQYAVNVMGVTPDFGHWREVALEGIVRTETFFQSIGMPVNIHELIGRDVTDAEIDVMVDKCSRGGTITVGTFKVLTPTDMRNIYDRAR